LPTVEFKYDLGTRVKTVVDDEGVIDDLSYGVCGNRYYVLMKGGKGRWFDEDQLTPLEE
jgi:hypothetical protein